MRLISLFYVGYPQDVENNRGTLIPKCIKQNNQKNRVWSELFSFNLFSRAFSIIHIGMKFSPKLKVLSFSISQIYESIDILDVWNIYESNLKSWVDSQDFNFIGQNNENSLLFLKSVSYDYTCCRQVQIFHVIHTQFHIKQF